jgi:hypothetical protein
MISRSNSGAPPPFRAIAILLCLLAALLLISCSDDDPVAPDTSGDLNAYISGLGTFPDPSAANTGEHVLKSAHADTNVEPGVGRFICQIEEYRMDKNLHETTVYNVNDVTMWPGALVRGSDLDNGLLNPIVAPRAPVTVGTDLTGLPAEQGSRTIANPNHLAVQGGLNEIVSAYIAQSGGAIGAKLSFDETFVEDFQQSMLDLGVSMSWWQWGNGSLQTDFAASTETFETSYLCRFSQAYFTASVLPPATPAAMFGSGVTPADIAAFTGLDDPPCYVSSVTYGRVGFLSIHSYARRDSVRMAVSAAFDGMGWDMGTEINAAFTHILNTSEIKILIRGGDATGGVLPILGDPVQGLRDWIEDGASLADPSDAVPISYTTRYLKDNRMASFAYSNEWTVEECQPATLYFEVAVPRLYCQSADDGLWDYTLEVYYEYFLEYQPFEGADTIVESIYRRASGNPVSMGAGTTHWMDDAKRTVWMPEALGSRFRLHIWVMEYDAASSDDTIGNFYTDWYAWPDWRAGGNCAYPVGFPLPDGEAAACSRHMQEDSGTDVIAYWQYRTPVPLKDW